MKFCSQSHKKAIGVGFLIHPKINDSITEVKDYSNQSSWKLSVLEIPLDKELTANCLVETRTKLEELILAAMVKYGLNKVQLPLWLQQSLFNGVSWHGLSWAKVVSEHL